MKNYILLFMIPFLILGIAILYINARPTSSNLDDEIPGWKVRSIDTMKYSRDLAREKMSDQSFDNVIDSQIRQIALMNTTHVVISTPYDEEFIPFLKRWVTTARRYGIKVWFRGNFSGWEGWFNYPTIDRPTHAHLTEKFILENKDLFEDGDIFTSCPECENGEVGDPRHNGDLIGHREFLIDEYDLCLRSFAKIEKKVHVGFYSMNYDVAQLVMDRPTTQALGNMVVIDHYVKDPHKLSSDIKSIAEKSGGKVVLGEFGVPIPSIHGEMSENAQAEWMKIALENIIHLKELTGLNYWVNVGGSTQLWDENGTAGMQVDVLKEYFFIATKK